jgi:hypothetical protein
MPTKTPTTPSRRTRREPNVATLPDDELAALHHAVLGDLEYLGDFLTRMVREMTVRGIHPTGDGRFTKDR